MARNLIHGVQYSAGPARIRRSRRSRITVCCARCEYTKIHEARGLCKCCYNRLREGRIARETLEDYPLGGMGSTGRPQSSGQRWDERHIPMGEARHDTA